MRAAAPQNQLALIRRVPGQPESSSMRSNAHWTEPKPGKAPQRKTLAIAAPAAPVQEPPEPKQGGFISAMPQPVQMPMPGPGGVPLESIPGTPHPAAKPTWEASIRPTETQPELAEFVDVTATPGSAQSNPPSARAIPLATFPPIITILKPDWAAPLAQANLGLEVAEAIEGMLAPQPLEYSIDMNVAAPPAILAAMQVSIPEVLTAAPVVAVYPSLPALPIDPVRFAPAFDVQVEMRSQHLPFRFDSTPFAAPDFEILEPAETPRPKLKLRPRPTLKHTEQEHVLDPPPITLKRKAAASSPALQMGTIGEIAALVNPVKSIFPKWASPAERGMVADPFDPPAPATVMPRSAALSFRPENRVETASPAVADPHAPEERPFQEQFDKRPSSLKVKLAAMAAAVPPAPPAAEAPQPTEPSFISGPPPERKPVERSLAAPPPRLAVTPNRRTIPIPSILEVPIDSTGEENKSLWGALRKYLKK